MEAVRRFLAEPRRASAALVVALLLLTGAAATSLGELFHIGVQFGAEDSGVALLPSLPLLALQVVPLLWRRRAPVVVLLVVGAAAVGKQALGLPAVAADLGVLIALYTVGRHASARAAVLTCPFAIAGVVTLGLVLPGTSRGDVLSFLLVMVAGPLAVGSYRRSAPASCPP